MSLKCNFCEYLYENQPISEMQLHKCADEEMHFINRIDLDEKPLEEITTEIRFIKKKNLFTVGMRF